MKKHLLWIGFFSLLLGGCLASNDEINTLKIKLLNLETTTQNHETRISSLEKKLEDLERRVHEEFSQKFIQAQSKVLADIEETRKEIAVLQGKIDEITFQQEGEKKSQLKTLDDLKTRIEALDLKIKDLEAKMKEQEKLLQERPSNQTATNATISPPATEKKPLPSEPQASAKEILKEEDLYQKAYSLYAKGDLKGARSLWEEYLKQYPTGKWVGQSHFYIGDIHFKEKDYESAILEYQRVIELPGPNPLKPKAMLKQAEAFLALKDKKAAQILYKKIIQNYPGTPEAKEAERKLKALK